MLKKLLIAASVTAALAAPLAQAQDMDFAVRVGFESVNPKSNNGFLANAFTADVESNTSFTLGGTLFFTPNWAVDFQTAIRKYNHEVRLNGAASADVEHRPTTLQAQYHFVGDRNAMFQPYIGIGYTWIAVEPDRTFGPLAGANLALSDSNGLSYEIGADVNFAPQWFARFSAERLKFETDARLNGAPIGTVSVNPWVWGASIGYRF